MTKQEAIKELTERYEEQCFRWPLMREDISLALYLKRNVPVLLRNRNRT